MERYLIELRERHIPSIMMARSCPAGVLDSWWGVEKIKETSRSHRIQNFHELLKQVVRGKTYPIEQKHQFEGSNRIQLAQCLEKGKIGGYTSDFMVPEIESELGKHRGRDSREHLHERGMTTGVCQSVIARPLPES